MKKILKINKKEDVAHADLVGEALGDFVKDSVIDEDDLQKNIQSAQDIDALIKQSDHDALNKVLLGTLNPQLARNEAQKRIFKEDLMKYIRRILRSQMILVSFPIMLTFITICIDIPFMKNIDSKQMQIVFEFLKYYIGAIIVEFIAMLFFIVKYVFDKSIVDLTKTMTDKK